MKIKKGDLVRVMVGKDRGKEGKVERVWPKRGEVAVPGANQYKKHIKKQEGRAGEILTLNRPIAMAKVAVICPMCKRVTRVGYKLEEGKKVRLCRKCGLKI